ncbi:hypothetical protein SAMN05216223_10958 [Actinacidiphila yanglinensis]|uniref:Integral membrane protein n=1 Tax=Actinacidiphila yanglinensis TaxID=310779 RepID=A0A1H6CJY3_9ACTN|nr:hypothetical protein SAMN05216223_10958 [Actinacidiphila yanglinensis]
MAEGSTENASEGTNVTTSRQAPAAAPRSAQARTEHTGSEAAPAAGEPEAAPSAKARIGTGPGRLLLSLYGVFTVAALSRSIVQLSTKYHEAPLAYVLSGVAGVVYAVITLALWRGGETARRVALVSCSAELLGVITVGIWTVVDSSAFPDATVWSDFGIGYVFLPIVLPVTGLLWLRRSARQGAETARSQQTGTGGA